MYTHTLGLGRRAGYALSLAWQNNSCSATTLRALTLPKSAQVMHPHHHHSDHHSRARRPGQQLGDTSGITWAAAEAELVNPAKRLARWLKLTEDRGHIQRGTLFIRALNPTALHHHATVDLDPADTYTARDFLDAEALGAIEVQIIEECNPAVAERRRAELDLLRTLLL
jgi:hypothetical protein